MKRGQLYDLWAVTPDGPRLISHRVSASTAAGLITTCTGTIYAFELRVLAA